MGDLIVDETWYVDAKKLSPEAPVPVGYLTSLKPHLSPGGASLAASYAIKQEYPFIFLTAASNDNKKWLRQKGINLHSLYSIENIKKIRYIDINSNYHLIRIDNDKVITFPTITEEKLVPLLNKLLKNTSCLVILDYQKGMFSDITATQTIIREAVRKNIPVYVDTRSDPQKFKMSTVLKLNEKEYVAASAAQCIESPQALCRKLNIPNLIITEGKQGATLHQIKKPHYQYIPNLNDYTGTPDVTGCGDVFDINFCYYCFQKGFTPTEALKLSVDKATEYAYSSIGDRLC